MKLKFALRNLLKRPFLNIIKIVGLSLALSCILLIVLFLKNELTFDQSYKNSDHIYRFTTSDKEGKHFARVYNPDYIPDMAKFFPEIENYVRLVPLYGGCVKYNENYIRVNQAFECDSTFFKIFDAKLVYGNSENVLNDPNSMVVSESFAKRVFGKSDAIGQILTLPAGQFYGKDVHFTIMGIMKDFPQNSHFHPEFISYPGDKAEFNRWAWTYLLLSDNANPKNILGGYKSFVSKQGETKQEDIKTEAHLQKITEIHLNSDKLREIETNGNMNVIYTLAAAALLLLFIAITNYVNLNIGMAVFIEKYLKIGKVFGSSGWENIKYFLSEGMIISIASFVITGTITFYANIYIQKHFGLDLFKGNMALIISVLALFFTISVVSGTFFMAKKRFISITSFFDKYKNTIKSKGISNGLIVLQYSVSIALIVSVIVLQRQTKYALKSGMGSSNSNMIVFENVHSDIQQKFELFKEELMKYNSINSVSAMFEPPGGEANDMFAFIMEGYIPDKEDKMSNMIGIFPCDYSFTEIFDLKFLSGRGFSKNNEDSEGSGEYIINESAMRKLKYKDPDKLLGKGFGLVFDGVQIPKGNIIGVVEDFHLSSIKKNVEPLVLFKRKELWLINFVVSFHPGMQNGALSDIENVWKNMFPEHPFDYYYVSSMYKNVYKTEILQSKLLSLFTIIALFISSIGLLGLSLLATQRRTKEIGIRTVNGAKVSELLTMLNWDFIKWILLSLIIATPLSYFAMNKWLENFAYKTPVSWWIFVVAGASAILTAFITVTVQSWKVANRNPVEALRYE